MEVLLDCQSAGLFSETGNDMAALSRATIIPREAVVELKRAVQPWVTPGPLTTEHIDRLRRAAANPALADLEGE